MKFFFTEIPAERVFAPLKCTCIRLNNCRVLITLVRTGDCVYNPVELSEKIEKIVVQGELRKYYRFRPAQYYGGIATADCVGCNLSCIYCWSKAPREKPSKAWRFYSPEQAFRMMDVIARKRGYSQLRISGNEPTIGKQHLLKLLELVERTDYRFILETNGILLGRYPAYARHISNFKCVHVRVSLKGCDPEQFSLLTGANPEAFELQLDALRNLTDADGSVHAAVMKEFAPEEKLTSLKRRLAEINPGLARDLELEYLMPFPSARYI